ncbi:MAG: CDP-alcohol phosphatidyltransferase family protein [Chitinispirillaceae bacterium]|nr:CDP-alcohol phosphatidyltransferase family protein [Chitinispirillaceae bacterium]
MLETLKPLYNKTLKPLALFLARLGLHPNHLTVAGVLFFAAAAVLCVYDYWKFSLLFVIAGGIFDGLDGVVARETGQSSVFGSILDSSCDRITEIVLLLGIMVYFLLETPVNNIGVILCFCAVSASLMVSYVKARCEGASVQCKGGILQRPERIILLSAGLLMGAHVMRWILGIIAVLGLFTSIQRLHEAAIYCRKQSPGSEN